MTNLIRLNPAPWSRLFADFDRTLDAVLPIRSYGTSNDAAFVADFTPDVDIAETDHAYLITVDVPGIHRSDVDIALNRGMLTIRGERKANERVENATFIRSERSQGTFERVFTLPRHVEADQIEARMEDGVLHVAIPKSLPAQPKKIKIG